QQPERLTTRRAPPPPAAGPRGPPGDAAAPAPKRPQPRLEAVEPQFEPAPEHSGTPVREQAEAVVVGRRTPQLEPGPGHEHVPTVDAQLRERSLLLVEDRPRPGRLQHAGRIRRHPLLLAAAATRP